jgi:hypothetical protein
MRVKVLAKEIERGIKSINALQARAYSFHIAEKPFLPGWVEEPASGPDAPNMDNKPTWDAESTTISQFVAASGVPQTNDTEEGEEDIIDLKLTRQVHQPRSILQYINV